MTRRPRGALEAEVLRVLWSASRPMTSSQVRATFDEAVRPALTTVLTVLDRMEAKGLVAREAHPGGALFSSVRSESEETAAAMARTLAGSTDRSQALLRFAGQLQAEDLSALRRALGGDG